jgi:hypothetical protein
MKQTALFVLIIALISCSKKNEDSVPPVVIINAPLSSQSFNRGDTIIINALITDNTDLAEVGSTVFSKVGTRVDVFNDIPPIKINGNQYMMSYNIITSKFFGTILTINVFAKDKKGNVGDQKINVTVN